MRPRVRRLLHRGSRPAPTPPPRLTAPGASDQPLALAVCHPAWRGVRTAAHAHGDPVMESAAPGEHAAAILVEARRLGVGVIVVHGYPPGTDGLLRTARAAGLQTRVVLHSSMTQHGGEAGEARVADDVVALLADGTLDGLGFVKDGIAEAFTALGHAATWVPNATPTLPHATPLDLGTGRHIGVFSEPFWRKNVVTQLGAVALMDGATAHVLDAPDVAYLRGMALEEHGLLPWERFVRLQASVDLNLYVTLSECYPLSPIESYAAGVPCLLSRTSSVFRDDAELWKMTTVEEHDNPRAIADAATRLLADRDTAVTRARDWITRWDVEAAQRWESFLSP